MYLNDGETQHGGRDIADPHAGKHGNEHIGNEDCSGACAGFTENEGGQEFSDVVL